MDTDTRYGLLITVYACYWLRPVLFRIWTQCAFDWAADSGEALGEALGDILVPLLLDRLSVRCYACEATSLRKPLPVWVDVQETVGDHTHFVRLCFSIRRKVRIIRYSTGDRQLAHIREATSDTGAFHTYFKW